MPTHNETLTDDITAVDTYVDVSSMDQTIDEAETGFTSSNNNTASSDTASSLVTSLAYVDVAFIDHNINESETGLDDSYNFAVSLLYNKTLDTLEDIAAFLSIGKPIIYSERDAHLPVVFYSRPDASKPVIYSNGAYGIEKTINRTARLRYAMNRTKEDETPTVESSQEMETITVDKTQDKSATVTSSWSHSVS